MIVLDRLARKLWPWDTMSKDELLQVFHDETAWIEGRLQRGLPAPFIGAILWFQDKFH